MGKALLILVALALLYWLSESGMLSKLVAICKTFAEMAHEHWWAMAALFVVNAMLEASLVLSTVPHVCHVLLPLSFGFAGGAAMIFGLAFSGTSAYRFAEHTDKEVGEVIRRHLPSSWRPLDD